MHKTAVKSFVLILAIALIFALVFLYNNALKANGEFLSDFLSTSQIATIEVNKIDTRTDDVKTNKTLNKDEKERMANYLSHQKFMKIRSDVTEYSAVEGFLITGKNDMGDNILAIKSYGDEFLTGYIVPANSKRQDFKLKIKDKNWLNHMECFLL